MKAAETPLSQDLVMLGGGHAHALALARWAHSPLPGARLTLVSPDPTTPYTGMLPGVVAGHYRVDEHEIDLTRLARRAGARLILDRAVGLDLTAKTALLADRGATPFDVLSIDIGATSEPLGVPPGGFTPVKPFGRFLPALDAYLAAVSRGEAAPRAAVLGGGLGGVELAFALAHRLRDHAARAVAVLTRSGAAPPGVKPTLWRRVLARAPAAGVEIVAGFEIARVEDGAAEAVDGRRWPADFFAAAAGARAAPWLAETGLPLDASGFIRVAPTLAVEGRSDVFAVGDVAALSFDPRPKAGVYSVRQAPILTRNLRAALIEPERPRLRRYRPQKDYLKLVSLGARSAIAEKAGVMAEGAAVWRLKDRIDRAFMRGFAPEPPSADPPPKARAAGSEHGAAPLCGGCGAKIGAAALEAALAARRAPPLGTDVIRGPGDDAAILSGGEGWRRIATIDQLRAFTDDPTLFAEIATQHALSDIWAMGGAPEAALVSMTLPRATPKLQARLAAEMLAGAEKALSCADAALIGGHTAEGAEMSLAVAALGRASTDALAQLSGPRPGDALVLTKPLGVGVLLAAEMRQTAPGAAVAAALRRMTAPNGPAAAALMAAGARAMTDVTGFGLLGHLARLLGDLGAEIALDAAPMLDGALELAAAGVRSSLHGANAQVLEETHAPTADPARLALLVDPQTAGGLLAALPPGAAAAPALRAAIPELAVIGAVEAAPPGGLRIRIVAAE